MGEAFYLENEVRVENTVESTLIKVNNVTVKLFPLWIWNLAYLSLFDGWRFVSPELDLLFIQVSPDNLNLWGSEKKEAS